MIRRLLLGLALACLCQATNAGEVATEKVVQLSMRFESHSEAPASICEKPCRTWISAAGPISERTPQDFKVFAEQHDLRGAALVLDSEGGSVVGAIEMGRLVRKLDMTTAVGKAVNARAADGTTVTKFSPKASCQSMCVFLVLAGKRRIVLPDAKLLVHQIWLTDKTKSSQTHSYTAEELALVQRDIGKLTRYTIEMGGDAELLETALNVPPWEALRRLTSDEIQRMNLVTSDEPSRREHAPVASVQLPTAVSVTGASRNAD